MVHGIGIDLIEVERVAKKIQKADFKNKVFTANEIAYCEANYTNAERFAARFAAKEAFFKALGTGWIGQFSFTEVEIVTDELGKPNIQLYGKVKEYAENQHITQISVSLTHLKSVAGAVVIIEK